MGPNCERCEAFLRRRAWEVGERRVSLSVGENGSGMRPRVRRVSLRV